MPNQTLDNFLMENQTTIGVQFGMEPENNIWVSGVSFSKKNFVLVSHKAEIHENRYITYSKECKNIDELFARGKEIFEEVRKNPKKYLYVSE